MNTKTKKLFFLCLAIFLLAVSCPAQDADAVQTDFRAKVRGLMNAKDYAGALALFAKLEAGKFELGNAATQADVLKDGLTIVDKGKVLVYLQRYDEADREFYRSYDGYLDAAEGDLVALARYYVNGAPMAGANATLAASSRSLAGGDLAMADSIKVQRDGAYIMSGARTRPFDEVRLARAASLKDRLAKFTP